jgi:hypothetical protein
VIVGFGPHLDEVKRDVAARGLEDHVTFTGPLYGDDLLRVLNSIDIGVAPDPKNPMNDISTMNKVMEYMTLEKPVVQFDLTEGRASAGEASLYARPTTRRISPQDRRTDRRSRKTRPHGPARPRPRAGAAELGPFGAASAGRLRPGVRQDGALRRDASMVAIFAVRTSDGAGRPAAI